MCASIIDFIVLWLCRVSDRSVLEWSQVNFVTIIRKYKLLSWWLGTSTQSSRESTVNGKLVKFLGFDSQVKLLLD